MDLNKYNGLKVKIILKNNYYYVGRVMATDTHSLTLIDINAKRVDISEDAILTIQEVGSA